MGIRTRGVPIAERLAEEIECIEGQRPPVGVLDITLYRDDLSTLSYQPIVHPTQMPVDITSKTIVLADDVLYTGRTIRAALDALIDMNDSKRGSLQYRLPLLCFSGIFILLQDGGQLLFIRGDVERGLVGEDHEAGFGTGGFLHKAAAGIIHGNLR